MDYKLAIRRIIREQIDNLLCEDIEDDYMEREMYLPMEIFQSIKDKRKVEFKVIPKDQYLKALREFMEYNSLMRFPFKYINQWKELVIENVLKLGIINSINGHSSNFPYDEFYDVFDYNKKTGTERDGEFSRWLKKKQKTDKDNEYKYNSWNNIFEYLYKVYEIENYLPKFSNGADIISDFGLAPLQKIIRELIHETDPNAILLLLDRVMNVVHPRSDLAELFIEGGSNSLKYISAAE